MTNEDPVCGCGYRRSLHESDPTRSTYCELAEARAALEQLRGGAVDLEEMEPVIAKLADTMDPDNARDFVADTIWSRTPEQKIAKAKALLFEATREIRAREKLARANDRCTCGHRREDHAVSHSINYTEGYCMVCPDVKGHSACRWFNFASDGSATVTTAKRADASGRSEAP